MIPGAPNPVAPFSHVVEADGWLFLTGQMPTYPGEPDRPLDEGVEAQTRRTMDNLIIVLDRDYGAMNETYQSYFPPDRHPARTCVGVSGLAVGALVEIDMVAKRPE
jgi:enamine deaminase RidA (YjgF/YER057c/UK114 family)